MWTTWWGRWASAGVWGVALAYLVGLAAPAGVVVGQPAPPKSPTVESALIGANVSVPTYPEPFQYGVNFGYTPGWDNYGFAQLANTAGSSTTIVYLPERLFAEFGGGNYNIEAANMTNYQVAGLTNLTAVLTGPTPAHSNAPNAQGTPWTDLVTQFYSPKNLYTNTWSSPGVPNPNNYWASYVFNTVTAYKNHVKIWQVWNEPDFTYSWQLVNDWYNRPPAVSELNRWNDSIYSYIRLMRITYEVVKYVDPNAFVAIGGIGYDGYLDAILRLTDNPVDGSITSTYPARGGAYFDVLSWHNYPFYNVYDVINQAYYTRVDSDGLMAKMEIRQHNFRMVLNKWGYDGASYPRKVWILSEVSVPSTPFNDNGTILAGGVDLQKNFYLKMALTTHRAGNAQVHWYRLADCVATTPGCEQPWIFNITGLFGDIYGRSIAQGQALFKPQAAGYKTYSAFMRNQKFDPILTATLNLPATATGYVFRQTDGRKTYAVWAKTPVNTDPNANVENTNQVSVTIATTVNLTRRNWDAGVTNTTTTLTPTGGAVTLNVTSTPVLLTEVAVTSTTAPVPAETLGALTFIDPVRVVDTRVGTTVGYKHDGAAITAGPLSANQTRYFKVAGQTFSGYTFPKLVSAVYANVTLVGAGASGGYAVMFPADVQGVPSAATVNPSAWLAQNFWSGRVAYYGSAAGSVAVHSTVARDVIVDVVGFWSPANSAALGNLKLVTPTRVVDTRAGSTVGFNANGTAITPGALTANTIRRFLLANKTFTGLTLPNDLAGALLHVTLVQSGSLGGYVTVFSGALSTPPLASTVNPTTPIAFNSWATAVAPSGGSNPGTIGVFSTVALDIVIDLVGYWSPTNPTTLGALTFTNPTRVVDTRALFLTGYNADGTPLTAGPVTAGAPKRFLLNGKSINNLAIPSNVKGVLLNVTLVQGAPSGGYVVVYPADVATAPLAATANPSTAIAGSFWASQVGQTSYAGSLAAAASHNLDLVVDVLGYFR